MKRIIHSLMLAAVLSFLTGATHAKTEDDLEIVDIQILKQTDARFPATMRAIGRKEGRVSLVLAIGPDGSLKDSFILQSSQAAFAKSALKSIAEWEFAPASCNGQPIDSSVRIDLSFKVDRKLAWQTFQAPVETNITRSAVEETPVKSSTFGELDAIPFPLKIVEPQSAIDGKATVEFYIDELGNVRCPRLTSGSSLEFGQTMLDAIANWKFQPPVADGERTNTFVKQTFSFVGGHLSGIKPD